MGAIGTGSHERAGEEQTRHLPLRGKVLQWLRRGVELASSARGRDNIDDLVGNLEHLRARLEQSRFHLAVLGQFKRGKSTLVNAFIGRKLLPSSVVPLTAVPTFIGFAERPQLHVVGLDGRSRQMEGASTDRIHTELERLVTECGNPENRRRILRVELGLPLELLRTGLVLIDTPGVGSTYRHNTQTTLDFLPQCDAAVFVVSADPPLTQTELEFLQEVKDRAGRLFFVLNKVDYLDDEERWQAVDFLAEQLASPRCPPEAQVKETFERRVPEYFRRQLEILAHRVAEHVEGRLAVYEAEAGELAEHIRRAAAEIFEIAYESPGASHAFEMDTSVYWSGYHWTPTFSPLPPGALDAMLPERLRRRRLEQRWQKQIRQLVMQNAETVRWQLLQSLIKAFAGFSARLESSLERTVEAVRHAAASAMEMRSRQAERLERQKSELSGLVGGLQQWLDSNPIVEQHTAP